VAQGILAKGLSVALTTITLNTEDVLKSFGMTTKTTTDQQDAIQETKMLDAEEIIDNVTPAMQELMTTFLEASENYLSYGLTIEKIKYSVFLLFCAFVFVVLWLPYLRSLNEKIFRTKGMLNMIPLEVIMKSENLKNAFLSGNLMQAVK